MTTYITDDGEIYEANNATELVDAMRATSWAQGDSRQEWMNETAERLEEMRGVKVKTTSCDKFVADMIAGGVLKEKE